MVVTWTTVVTKLFDCRKPPVNHQFLIVRIFLKIFPYSLPNVEGSCLLLKAAVWVAAARLSPEVSRVPATLAACSITSAVLTLKLPALQVRPHFLLLSFCTADVFTGGEKTVEMMTLDQFKTMKLCLFK